MCSYLVGSIPFGYLIYKIIAKDDIRKYGSGNIGSTNVGRLLGRKYAIITFALDAIKGAVMVVVARIFLPNFNIIAYLAGCSAILGHIYSVYLGFKGGKGFATFIAVVYALNIWLGLIMSVTWLIVFKITKISALAALLSLSILNCASWVLVNLRGAIVLLLMSGLIVYRHKNNIERLISGNELAFKKRIKNL